MRSAMLTILVACVAMAAPAQASDSATSHETTNPDRATEKVAPKTSATADAIGTEEFKLPPGFKEKKRGKVTLYCIKGKATGTRFQTEDCYDKAQLHDYLLAREQNNRDFDRSRSICSDPGICAPK